MKKKDFVKLLSERAGLSQKDGNTMLNIMFSTITDTLMDGDDISVPGFGKFSTSIRSARTCRNPQTGEPMEVPEKRVPKFKAASALKQSLLQ